MVTPAATITPATDAELPAALALLGPVTAPATQVFVGRLADGRLAGAGGVRWESWGDPAAMPAWVGVLPDCRRRGVGRALAARLRQAVRGEADGLWAATPLDEEGEAAGFARAAGFAAERRQYAFRMESRPFLAHLEGVVGRLRAKERVPEGAAVARLSRPVCDAVARLFAAELASAPPDLRARLDAAMAGDPATAPVDRERSAVLTVDGALAGALLSVREADGRGSRIVGNVVARSFRGLWANALLLEETTRNGVEAGSDRILFDCDEGSRDTLGLAVRGGATRLRTTALFRYAASGAG